MDQEAPLPIKKLKLHWMTMRMMMTMHRRRKKPRDAEWKEKREDGVEEEGRARKVDGEDRCDNQVQIINGVGTIASQKRVSQ
jgi:hypothetical protein